MSHTVTLSSKGQVTIPKAIRDRLALEPGDRVVFCVRGELVVLEPLGSLMDWYGSAAPGAAAEGGPAVRESVRREIGRQTTAEGAVPSDERASARS